MKTIKLLAVGILLLLASTTEAQVSVNVNIGRAPSWGPSGYANVDYYYLPDVQAYYDIRASQFIYFGQGRWVRSTYLPGRYRNYDLYNGYKVVLNDYHGHSPYRYYNDHKAKYRVGYKGPYQRTIGHRNSDHRYSQNSRSANDRHYSGGRQGSHNNRTQNDHRYEKSNKHGNKGANDHKRR
jgi:hypothetical protein